MNRCVEKFTGIYYNEEQPRFWFADNKKFYNKLQALDHGKTSGVSFHVNDDEYESTPRREYNLKKLLKQRARQLRDKFDYIRIWYSGGKDSLTIIDSFLEAGCKIDEIATIYTSPTGNEYSLCDIEYTVADYDLKSRGLSRTKYKSTLETYKKMYVDIEDFFYKISNGEMWLRSSRQNAVYTLWPETLSQTKNGMMVAEITGDQRPYVYKKDGKIWFYFLDTVLSHIGSPNTEDFYVTPDMPELMVAQAQGLSEYLDSITTSAAEWNKLASMPKIQDKNILKEFANSYGRNMPTHDILQTNIFGKLINDVEYSNYKHQSAAGELQSSDQGKIILDHFNQQISKMHNKYNFDNYVNPVGCYSKFHSLDSLQSASKQDIIGR